MANTIPSTNSISVDLQASEVKKTSVTVTDKSGQTTTTETVDAVSVNISASLQSGSQAHNPDRLERAKSRFDRLDSDKGGFLTKDELVSLKQDRNSRGIKTPGLDHLINNFSTIDQNGDGNISKEEFKSRPAPGGQANQPPPPPPADSASPAAAPDTSTPVPTPASTDTTFDFSNLLGNVVLGKVFQGFSSTEPISTSSSGSSSSASSGSTPASGKSQTAIIDFNSVLAPVVGSILGAATEGDSALSQAVQSYLAFKSDATGTENENLQKYDLNGKV